MSSSSDDAHGGHTVDDTKSSTLGDRTTAPRPQIPKGGTLDDSAPPGPAPRTKPATAEIPFSPTLANDTPTPPPTASVKIRPATPLPVADTDDDLLDLPEVDGRRYSVEGTVGKGGLGVILKARDRVLDRTVAIKRGQRRDDVATTRFIREALVTARLQHPAIVPVYDAGRWNEGNDPYYAMKLVSGSPLSAKVTKTTTLEERMSLLPNVIAVADAMAYAHGERIIHRDLKPDNVLVGEFGETVVIDWGLAKDLRASDADEQVETSYQVVAQGLTVDGAIMGTPEYMAPEQARGDTVDERADVYAIGGLLYFVLVGEAPFRGTSKDEIIAHILEQQLDPLEVRHPHIPHDLAVIVTKAMQRKPEDRYRTAKELAEDLRRFQTGQLVSARNYTAWQLIKRWAARNRRLIALSGLFVAATIAIAIYAFVNMRAERNEAQAARATAELKTIEAKQQTAEATKRSNELILANASSNLETDPTTTLAYLKTYPLDGSDWAQVRELVIAAQERGVARHVVQHDTAGRVALSADGRVVVTGGGDKELRIWDTAKGTELARIAVPYALKQNPRPLAIARDASLLAYVDGHDDVYLADLPSGTPRLVWHAERSAMIAISPDARVVVSVGAALQIYDRKTTSLIQRPEESDVIAFAPDGRFATSDQKAVRIWDPTSASVAKKVDVANVSLLVFSPDGSQLAAAGGLDPIRILGSGATLKFPGGSGPVEVLAFTNGGKEVVALHDRFAFVWAATGGDPKRVIPIDKLTRNGLPDGFSGDGSIATFATAEGVEELDVAGDTLHRLGGYKDNRAVALSADGTTLVAYGVDSRLRIWKRDRTPSWTVHYTEGQVIALAFSPDDKLLATASTNNMMQLTSLVGDRGLIAPTANVITHVSFSPTGTWLVSAGYRDALDLWRLGTRDHVTLEQASVGAMATTRFAADGRTLYSSAKDGVRIWNLENRTSRVLAQVGVLAIDVAPDGRSLATGNADGRVLVWDIAAGTAREVGHHRGPVGRVHFLPNGRQVVSFSADSGDNDRTVRLWSLDGGTGTLLFEAASPIRAGALSRDGRWLAAGGMVDGTIWAFEIETTKARILTGHTKPIRALEFSPDATLLASGGHDNSLRLWRMSDSASQILHRHDNSVRAIAFSHDGRRIASSSNDATAWVGSIDSSRFVGSDTRSLVDRISDLTTVVIPKDEHTPTP